MMRNNRKILGNLKESDGRREFKENYNSHNVQIHTNLSIAIKECLEKIGTLDTILRNTGYNYKKAYPFADDWEIVYPLIRDWMVDAIRFVTTVSENDGQETSPMYRGMIKASFKGVGDSLTEVKDSFEAYEISPMDMTNYPFELDFPVIVDKLVGWCDAHGE